MSKTKPIAYSPRLALARARRVGRLMVFGFEQLVLTRLFKRRRRLAHSALGALLKTKKIDAEPPALRVTGSEGAVSSWSEGFAAAQAALFLNLRNPDALSPYRHALPGPPFRAVYLWDSAFIAQVWKWWDPEVAWETLHSVIALRDGDRLQHLASEFSRSTYTQPPLVAWSLLRLTEAAEPEQQLDWLRAAYEPLAGFNRWLKANRRLPNGLYAWAHTYESGVENAPRFASRDERELDDTRRLASPDFSTYVALQCEALAEIARRLGHADRAAEHAGDAQALRDAMNGLLWDERDGLYYDLDLRTGAFVRSRTIASLLPLWAGAPSADQAERLRRHIMDADLFNTLIPLPSVALSDAAFERDMWRGPVWVNTAFAVIEGLRRYGLHQEASQLAYALCDGVYQVFDRYGHFFEFYDPTSLSIESLNRKRGNRWKRLTLGSKPVADFVGWTGLVNTLVVEALFGVRRQNGALVAAPTFPPRAEGRAFTLSLPRFELAIELEVLPQGATRGVVRGPTFQRPFEAAFGEVVSLTHEPIRELA